jgi:hypothetical protein
MTKLITSLSPYQLLVDTFDYKKAGVSHDGMVRDIQTVLIGEITMKWKAALVKNEGEGNEYIGSLLNFVNMMAGRTLVMFMQKHENEGVSSVKDHIGLSLLNAITLFNCTLSHRRVKASELIHKGVEQEEDKESEPDMSFT